ncbi:feruloyl-CoA synthase [Xanthomonas indica]|uniref:Feruloyl-CoA synthase n=1 Tax=Xanthomonas indica TaxID=2912242 RepID=A0AAU8I6P6_9XANT|nr:feruloyl-CoA synthase [Xanthomonas indica]MCI2261062.1 feruloyl-CoA synthase [Xanthomonas indica]
MNAAESVATAVRYRPVGLSHADTEVHRDADGVLRLRAREPLAPLPRHLLQRLQHWALHTPDATFVAQRDEEGQWRRLSYAQMLERTRRIAAHLLDMGLSAQRPLAILSGNDLEHLQVAFAAMYAGIPYCPVSPGYALLSRDFAKLRHVAEVLRPGLLFASDGDAFVPAIAAVFPADVPAVCVRGTVRDRACLRFEELLAPRALDAADAAFAACGPDSIAKFLFTSGSTLLPKAVITTQRMLCANQQMLLQTFPVLGQTPVLVDWLPWNHTFGGSHNIGIALYNGGSFYLDDGKPTPALFQQTLRNLREIAPTVYLSVPRGWEQLAQALEQDAALRETFLSRMRMFFFAAAALSQEVWDRLERIAEAHCGERIRMLAGLGMTECAPSCTFTHGTSNTPGDVGVPAPGCEVKLVPVGDKLEARFRGPHVMPGYWNAPQQTAEAFDEEGFYRSGDALKPIDPQHPEHGLLFDGRLAEDFKLSSGVFVSVGPLRTRVLMEGAAYVQDVVVTGADRDAIGLLLFPRLDALQALSGLPAQAEAAQVLQAPPVRAWLQRLLDTLNRSATGSASHVACAAWLEQPPSLETGEITDKGSINQRNVLRARAALVEQLYAGTAPGAVAAPPS